MMKVTLLFLVLCAVLVALNFDGANADADVDLPPYARYNPYSYQYMMCRLKCRQSCLDQGYWKGVCKQGACFCYGLMGPYGQSNGFVQVPNY